MTDYVKKSGGQFTGSIYDKAGGEILAGGGGEMVYPAAGLALSTGSAWGSSVTNNSTNWNTAYTDRLKWDGGATGLTAATGRTSLELGTIATLAAPSGTVVGTSDTQTLTNKRVTPRVSSETSSATPTINTDNVDAHSITALAADITSMTTNLSGTPTNFQRLIVRIKDNGTARAITWGASFEARGVALPTTTVISKVLTVGFLFDTVTSKWGCVASAQEA
jgi:hypothetical protein